MTTPTLCESDLDLTRYVTEAAHRRRKPNPLVIPDAEQRRRDYDQETERLRLAIRTAQHEQENHP